MATIFRGPIEQPRFKRDSAAARQFTAAGLALVATVFPAGHSTGIEAPARVQNSAAARDFQPQNRLPILTATTPTKQTDWPLAKAVPRKVPDTLLVNPTVPTGAAPFTPLDWPLAKGRRGAPDYLFVNRLPLANVFPVGAQLDWSLPKAVRRVAPDTPYVNLLPIITTIPPQGQLDWSLPKLSRQALDTPSINLLPFAATAPFAQYDWPLPHRIGLSPPDFLPPNLLPFQTPAPPVSFQVDGGYGKRQKFPKTNELREAIEALVIGAPVLEKTAGAVIREVRGTTQYARLEQRFPIDEARALLNEIAQAYIKQWEDEDDDDASTLLL